MTLFFAGLLAVCIFIAQAERSTQYQSLFFAFAAVVMVIIYIISLKKSLVISQLMRFGEITHGTITKIDIMHGVRMLTPPAEVEYYVNIGGTIYFKRTFLTAAQLENLNAKGKKVSVVYDPTKPETFHLYSEYIKKYYT